jgi:hypothetical protein
MGTTDVTRDAQPATLREGEVPSHVTPVPTTNERPTLAELPTRPLHELDIPMTMRVLRFEVALEERDALQDPRLGVARALRSLLLRASGYAASESDGAASLETSVAHVIRRTYAWAFRALDAAIAAQPVRPLPRAAERLVAEVIDACEARVSFDPALARLRDILRDLGEAAARLSGGRRQVDAAEPDRAT